MPEVDRVEPSIPTNHDVGHPVTKGKRSAFIRKLVPWLLGICLVGFVGLVVFGAYEALTGLPIFVRATPTSTYLAGTEVKLVQPDGESVTVWQMGPDCQVGIAFGQVPPGTDGRILDAACYNPERKTYYHQVALINASVGWVAAGDMVPASEYIPPTPTEGPDLGPAGTPAPAPTVQPTQAPPPTPLPMGSTLSAGPWLVRVDRVEIADSLSSPSGDKTVEAAGRFALVFLTVTNRGFQVNTLHASSVYIEDAEGNRYLNNDLASPYASSADCLDFALELNQGESVCMVTAVDISDQGDFYVFSLQGASECVLLDVP